MYARFLTPTKAAAERYWCMIAPLRQFSAGWRVPPTQQIPTLLAVDGVTTGRMMRWGLILYRREIRCPLINAPVEKRDTWYGWRDPWEHGQRCIFTTSGFYEPRVFPGGRKEPLVVSIRDRDRPLKWRASGSIGRARTKSRDCHVL